MLALYATAQLFQRIQTLHIEKIKAEGEKEVDVIADLELLISTRFGEDE